uniref:Glycosyltransferases n=1 Tax=Kalanchoe fedtschenkoi TaxID=63787 RepID=A0A7N0RHW4_KALFE
MASIRRTLSPVPRAGALMNGEAVNVSSPLSRASNCAQTHAPPARGFLDSHSLFYKLEGVFIGLFSRRPGRPLERSKHKSQAWRKSLSNFLICFMVGIFIGFTSFLSTRSSVINFSTYQALDEMTYMAGDTHLLGNVKENVMTSEEYLSSTDNATAGEKDVKTLNRADEAPFVTSVVPSPADNSTLKLHKFLIVVTPTYTRPFQTYYLNRLAHTLKLVPSPLLWIVVEQTAQSSETADLLRKTGLMYRHLVCDDKNLTDTNAKVIGQRNVALSHIEKHRLDGIVYFADDDNVYSNDLFDLMRQIRRFGTWAVAKITEAGSKPQRVIDGPVCNGSEVIGWQADGHVKKYRRFHADMPGFAFNSTILWDPSRWHRRTLEPIRQRDTVTEELQVSTFIEQVVEDERQMECLPTDNSAIMVWHIQFGSAYSYYPHRWFLESNLDVVVHL